MTMKKTPYSKLSRSGKYYRKNKKARAKKKKYDTEYNKKTVQQRSERNAARKKLVKKYGKKGMAGYDAAHTSNGVRKKKISKNRGSSSDRPGDKRARGKKK